MNTNQYFDKLYENLVNPLSSSKVMSIFYITQTKVAGDKGISETKSKQHSPCSNCIPWPVTSWGSACSSCMHKPERCIHRPVMSQANICTYCMGSKVSSLSRIYLHSSYFDPDSLHVHTIISLWKQLYLNIHRKQSLLYPNCNSDSDFSKNIFFISQV